MLERRREEDTEGRKEGPWVVGAASSRPTKLQVRGLGTPRVTFMFVFSFKKTFNVRIVFKKSVQIIACTAQCDFYCERNSTCFTNPGCQYCVLGKD